MSKVIEVTECANCPFYSYYMNVPRCKKVHQEIPYELKNGMRKPIAIPDFCPLEDKDEYCESNFDIDRKF